jgi:hypothetical protein
MGTQDVPAYDIHLFGVTSRSPVPQWKHHPFRRALSILALSFILHTFVLTLLAPTPTPTPLLLHERDMRGAADAAAAGAEERSTSSRTHTLCVRADSAASASEGTEACGIGSASNMEEAQSTAMKGDDGD